MFSWFFRAGLMRLCFSQRAVSVVSVFTLWLVQDERYEVPVLVVLVWFQLVMMKTCDSGDIQVHDQVLTIASD